MKVYIVTSGSYSDYSIRGVFLDRTRAEALVAYLNDEDTRWLDAAGIEEFEADQPVPDKPGWSAWANVGVAISDVRRTELTPDDRDWKQAVVRWTDGSLHVNVLAVDAAHAVKIAADKFREFIANGG